MITEEVTPEVLNIIKQQAANSPIPPPTRIEIHPKPEFCLKLRKQSDDSKIFINVCSHEKIPAPKDKSEEELAHLVQQILKDDDESMMIDYRVAMSIGEPHMESSKDDLCVAYDVVLNGQFVKKTLHSEAHFTFLLHMLFQGIASKYGCEFKDNWVKLKNKKYFGDKIQKQFIAEKPQVDRAGIETVDVKQVGYEIFKTSGSTAEVVINADDHALVGKICKHGPEFR